ncbi:MAG: helix-turn-helix transcriptional regulator [Lachnospiraceae bacterium]|nr:helix-turn-helix transcriptional regulator [Lachnospiraceae bacterium]
MNEAYLLNSVSIHAGCTVRKFRKNHEIDIVARYDSETDDSDFTEIMLAFPGIPFKESRKPFLFGAPDRLVFAYIPLDKGFYVMGPCRFSSDLPLKYNYPGDESADTVPFSGSVPLCSAEDFCNEAVFLYNLNSTQGAEGHGFDTCALLTESCRGMNDFDDAMPTLYKTIFSRVEENNIHNPYNHERRQLSAIRSGNTEMLESILREDFSQRYGTLAEDPVKQAKYIGIVETTLSSRAAIEGGIHPEQAYSLSDIVIQKLDACTDEASIKVICTKMKFEYAKMVYSLHHGQVPEQGENENIHISHCKDYIFSHLHGRITVYEIANAIGLEENYLSSLFRHHEHKTLTTYIMEEKIALARNMLVYSDYTFAQVSAYLGFSSQSHFGQTFKKITGMTPRSFRNTYADDDFINSSFLLS